MSSSPRVFSASSFGICQYVLNTPLHPLSQLITPVLYQRAVLFWLRYIDSLNFCDENPGLKCLIRFVKASLFYTYYSWSGKFCQKIVHEPLHKRRRPDSDNTFWLISFIMYVYLYNVIACLQLIIMLYRWWVVMDILYCIIVEHGHIFRVERTYKKIISKLKVCIHT